MFGFFRRKAKCPDSAAPKKQRASLEEQIAVLQECGIRLLPGITIEHFLISWDRAQYESEPYRLALVKIGGEIEEAPWGRRLSNDVWHFDTECIEDSGDYARIAQRMTDLAGPDLPLMEITDQVDVEGGSAWVEFGLDGQRVHWDAKVDDDWVDSAILSRFSELLKERKTGRRFTYFDLKGQDCLIGCCSDEQRQLIRKRTGLDFIWLE